MRRRAAADDRGAARARARFQLPLRLYMVVRGREYLEAPDPLAAAAAALDLTLRGALNLDAAAGAGLLPRVCALIDADPDAALDLRTALGAATLLRAPRPHGPPRRLAANHVHGPPCERPPRPPTRPMPMPGSRPIAYATLYGTLAVYVPV